MLRVINIFGGRKKIIPQRVPMTPIQIKQIFQKTFNGVKAIVKLNQISQGIRKFGTSAKLFDVATRNRAVVQKLLFPLFTFEEIDLKDEMRSLPFPLLHPNSLALTIWSPIFFLLLLYTAIVLPYRIAFQDVISEAWINFDYFIDALFWIDLLVNMFTTYTNEHGEIERRRSAVMCKYIKSWFVVDFLACLPFESILSAIYGDVSAANSIRLIKLARVPRIYRLFRITKIAKVFKSTDKFGLIDFL